MLRLNRQLSLPAPAPQVVVRHLAGTHWVRIKVGGGDVDLNSSNPA